MLNHWWRHLARRFGYRLNAPRRSKSPAAPQAYRPGLETLEDRTLMTAGVLDAAFGSGGFVNTNVVPGAHDDFAGAVAVQSNGRIVVAGFVQNGGNNDFVVARYTNTGVLDTTFGGGDGIVITDLGGNAEEAVALVIQADGKIVVGGFTDASGDLDFALVRYNTDGTLDTAGFGGGDGIVTTDFGGNSDDRLAALALSGTKIVAVGRTDTEGTLDFAVAQYDAAGVLDTGFGGGDGLVNTDFASDEDVAFAVKIDGSNNIVVAGYAFGAAPTSDFALARYDATGTLDGAFGTGGKFQLDIAGDEDVANALGFLADGDIVVGGYSVQSGTGQDFTLIRFDVGTNGLDASFGTGGIVSTDIRGGDDTVSALLVNTIGGQEGIVVVGSAFAGITSDDSVLALARYDTAGALDVNFGLNANGVVTDTLGVASSLGTAVTADALGRIVVTGYSDRGANANDFIVTRYLVADPFVMTPVLEDSTNPTADTINAILKGTIGGIAVTGLSGTANGAWQYALGTSTTFTAFGTVSETSARLLRSGDRIRFVPGANFNGDVGFSFVTWDQTVGTVAVGPTGTFNTTTSGAFGADAVGVSLEVTPVNDAPVLNTATTVTLPGVAPGGTPSPSVTVATFAGALITDVDGDPKGIAITAVTGTGTWQYRVPELNGGAFTALPSLVTPTGTAFLLRATDEIRFVPNSGFNGTATISFRAWDGSDGSAGSTLIATATGAATPFSTGLETASLVVNSAPVLAAASPSAPTPITEGAAAGAAILVSSILGGTVTDPGGAQGIVITGVSDPGWQYSISGGAFTAIGTVSEAAGRLLKATDSIRFVPPNVNFAGTATFTFRAWDQTVGTAATGPTTGIANVTALGTGGQSAFSTTTNNFSQLVTNTNDAPTINTLATGQSPPKLIPVAVNDTAQTGQTVLSLVGSFITDLDAGALKGIGIVSFTAPAASGKWQFNTGSGFQDFPTIATGKAFVLEFDDLIRFLPTNPLFTATSPTSVKPTFTYRAWDQTGPDTNTGLPGIQPPVGGTQVTVGTPGGTTAFSATTQVVSVLVNSRPTFTVNNPTLPAFNEDTPAASVPIYTLTSFVSVSDVGTGAQTGFVVTGATGNGTWQFSPTATAAFVNFPTISPTSALLLPTTARLKFLPAANFNGTATVSLRGWDRTVGTAASNTTAVVLNIATLDASGLTALSTNTGTLSVTVTAINDAPTLSGSNGSVAVTLPKIQPASPAGAGVSVASLVSGLVSDSDGNFKGIAIVGATTTGGTWEFMLSGGSWTAFGTVSGSAAILLPPTARVRFVPSGTPTAGNFTFDFRAWDGTQGSPGAGFNITGIGGSGTGGSTAFSSIFRQVKQQVAL